MPNNDLLSRLGVQSYCFRALAGLDELTGALAAAGVANLELYRVHFDAAAETDPGPALARFARAGIRLSAYGVHSFGPDRAVAERVFGFARRAGVPVITADIVTGGLEVVEELAPRYGVRVAVHNHGRRHRLGSVAALEDLFARASGNVGLCLDTAYMLDSGEDPLAVARRFRDRLYALHLKDFVFDRAGRPSDVVTGTGNLDLPGLLGWLKETGYQGVLTLEYEAAGDQPVPVIRECLAVVRRAMP